MNLLKRHPGNNAAESLLVPGQIRMRLLSYHRGTRYRLGAPQRRQEVLQGSVWAPRHSVILLGKVAESFDFQCLCSLLHMARTEVGARTVNVVGEPHLKSNASVSLFI
jgi:hypothetical protein